MVLANFTQLSSLDLSYNQLTGPIPSNINIILNSISNLFLYNTSFIGFIPSSLFMISSLTYLDLSRNQFTGSLLLQNMSSFQLNYLSLYENKLTGPFPTSLFKLTNLTYLDLSSNRFNGTIDFDNLFELSHLRMIGLSDNNLSLKFTNKTSTLPKFLNIRLSSCNINGNIPNFLRSQGELEILDLSNNKLEGKIPKWFCKLSNFVILDASNNSLSGSLPDCLGSLSVLKLQGNNFEGEIPKMSTINCSITTLDLSHNKLQGEIPESLNKCKGIQVLNLGHNQLNDTFPFMLQNLRELKVLVLRSNKFHGPIWNSHHFFGFVKLKIIDLSLNNFNGTLPSDYFRNWTSMTRILDEDKSGLHYIGNEIDYYYKDSLTLMDKGLEMKMERILTIFMAIDLSNNNLHGELPKSMAYLQYLRVLNLSSNNFNGLIPSSLKNLTSLESLDLSINNFSGRIPPQLTSLTFLEYLNLSQNKLTGPIPTGRQFNTFENSSFEGNLGLCGPPLSNTCETHDPPTSYPSEEEHKGSNYFDWKITLIGYGSGLVVGIFIEHVIFIPRWIYWFLRVLRRNLC